MNSKILPYKTYTNLDINKKIIYKENRNKTAIYRLNNLVTGESYVGSAVDLTRRLWCHFSLGFLKKELRRNRSIISSSLLKYGYSNFSLDILEFCDKNLLIEREQYYFNMLKPEYNILKTAGSRLGCKHSPETLLKFNNRKLSPDSKKPKSGKTSVLSLTKINSLLTTGHTTIVINKETNSIVSYNSIRAAARNLKISHSSLIKYIKTNKLYKDIYIITRISKI
jgi:hypothetical protein